MDSPKKEVGWNAQQHNKQNKKKEGQKGAAPQNVLLNTTDNMAQLLCQAQWKQIYWPVPCSIAIESLRNNKAIHLIPRQIWGMIFPLFFSNSVHNGDGPRLPFRSHRHVTTSPAVIFPLLKGSLPEMTLNNLFFSLFFALIFSSLGACFVYRRHFPNGDVVVVCWATFSSKSFDVLLSEGRSL